MSLEDDVSVHGYRIATGKLRGEPVTYELQKRKKEEMARKLFPKGMVGGLTGRRGLGLSA